MISASLLCFCIVAEVARELCFKNASEPLAIAVATRNWAAAVSSSSLWLGLLIWVVETFAWIAVLTKIPLGIAYPITAVTYALAPLFGWFLLGERLRPQQIVGVLLVTAGAACVGASGI